MPSKVPPKKPYLRSIVPGPLTLCARRHTIASSKLHFNETISADPLFNDYRENSNIYVICTRPHATFVQGSIRLVTGADDRLAVLGLIEVTTKNRSKFIHFDAKADEIVEHIINSNNIHDKCNKYTPNIAFVSSSSPHAAIRAVIQIIDSDGLLETYSEQFEMEAFFHYFKWYIPEIQDLRIEYIGQSIGRKYKKGAKQRLSERHDERLKVMNRLSMERDIDIICIYLSFHADLIGFTGSDEIDMPRPNIIDVVEGALIHYFKPDGNTMDKHVFPQDRICREELCALRIEDSAVEFSADDVCIRFFTNERERSFSFIVQHEYSKFGIANDISDEPPLCILLPEIQRGSQQIKLINDPGYYINEISDDYIIQYNYEIGEGWENKTIKSLSEEKTIQLIYALSRRLGMDAGPFFKAKNNRSAHNDPKKDSTTASYESAKQTLYQRFSKSLPWSYDRGSDLGQLGNFIESYIEYITKQIIALHRLQFKALQAGIILNDHGLIKCQKVANSFIEDLSSISFVIVLISRKFALEEKSISKSPLELNGLPDEMYSDISHENSISIAELIEQIDIAKSFQIMRRLGKSLHQVNVEILELWHEYKTFLSLYEN